MIGEELRNAPDHLKMNITLHIKIVKSKSPRVRITSNVLDGVFMIQSTRVQELHEFLCDRKNEYIERIRDMSVIFDKENLGCTLRSILNRELERFIRGRFPEDYV